MSLRLFSPFIIAGILLVTSFAPASASGAPAPIPLNGDMASTGPDRALIPPDAYVPGDDAGKGVQEENKTFYTYETLTEKLKKLADEHPGIVQLYDVTSWIESRYGFRQTWEGRTVWGVRVSSSPKFNDPGRPKIIVECSHHAREWMGFETGMALVDALVDSYKAKKDINCTINISGADWSASRLSWLVDNRDIWVIPMVNPDGITHDQEMTASGSGSWRKNVRDNNNNGVFDPDYDGVDINRNYPWMWCHNTKGIVTINGISYTQDSSVPSSEQYHGPQDNYDDDGDAVISGAPDWWIQRFGPDWNGVDEDPSDGIDNDGDGKVDEDWDGGLSEPETCAVNALFDALDSDGEHMNGVSDVSIGVSLHSYEGCVMWPWGYTSEPAPHVALMEGIGKKMAAYASYDAYQSADMYLTSGDTSDWFYAAKGVLPFCIELGTGEQGGFHPKPEMIDNISMPNVQSLLYCAEVADVAKVAFGQKGTSLDIGIPAVTHTPRKEIPAGQEYRVDASVDNATNLAERGLTLLYRSGTGSWSTVSMGRTGEGKYSGVIPGQSGGSRLEYYIRSKDTFNTTHFAPSYAPYDVFSSKVTGVAGGTLMWGGLGVVVLIAGLALVWRVRRQRLSRAGPDEQKK
jgi:hypothetical protein